MKEPTAPELLQAVVKIKELCSNRKRCKGCIFNCDVIRSGTHCAIIEPYSWRLNNIQEYLNAHIKESEETK